MDTWFRSTCATNGRDNGLQWTNRPLSLWEMHRSYKGEIDILWPTFGKDDLGSRMQTLLATSSGGIKLYPSIFSSRFTSLRKTNMQPDLISEAAIPNESSSFMRPHSMLRQGLSTDLHCKLTAELVLLCYSYFRRLLFSIFQ